MIANSTLAASCAALSSAIIQLLSDTGNYARRVRDARHDINKINSELLAIKTSLEIAQDDFASTSASFPLPLLEAVSGVLECCGNFNGNTHKLLIQLSGGRIQRESWNANKKEDLIRLRRQLEVLHMVLDLALDHVSIFTLPSLRSNSPSTPGRDDCLRRDTQLVLDLLKRIAEEKERVAGHPDEKLMNLECWLAELEICAKITYDGFCADEAASKRPDSPLQGHEVPQCGRTTSALSSQSTGSEIGAWIDHVASHVALKSIERPERKCTSGPPDRSELIPSRSTFYTESTTSESIYSGMFKKYKSRPRSVRPRSILQVQDLLTSPSVARPVTANSAVSVHDVLRSYINVDKVAIAKSKRADSSPFQIFNMNRDLQMLNRTGTHETVQRLLFAGADPNVEDAEFGFLFIRAAFELPTTVLRLLVEYGAEVTKPSSTKYHSVLHAAVLGNQLSNLKYLIDLGLPIDTPNPMGETALHFAAKTPGTFTIAKYLLEVGADVNANAREAGTPLHTALVAKDLDSKQISAMVELLMAHGADDELACQSGKMRGKGLSVLGII